VIFRAKSQLIILFVLWTNVVISPFVSFVNCSALPRYNKDDIDKDIEAVKGWIEKSKDEL
jgi:hypothetical protein